MPNRYVFIAIGGTGTKVAQALVTLLTLGLPLHRREGKVRGSESLEDSLTIWRLDPDANNGGKEALEGAVRTYREQQKALGLDPNQPGVNGIWSLKVEEILSIDPLQDLPKHQNTLEKILNSSGNEDAGHVLGTLYTRLDRDQDVTRGFYQKPFIGSALLANTPAKFLEALGKVKGDATRLFVCGSLFGGTGAAGVPVLSSVIRTALKDFKGDVAGCLLGPYFRPPQPPRLTIPAGDPESLQELLNNGATADDVDAYVERVQLANPGLRMSQNQVKQILGGYYARPHEIFKRAASSMGFYADVAPETFSRLYYVGHPHPTEYALSTGVTWSNGGADQQNPSHAVEYVAAIAAADFFSRPDPKKTGIKEEQFDLPCSYSDLKSGVMVDDLPCYGGTNPDEVLDPARWIFATLVGYQFLRHHVGPDKVKSADQLLGSGFKLLEAHFGHDSGRFGRFRSAVAGFLEHQGRALNRLLASDTDGGWQRTLGWSGAWLAEAKQLMTAERGFPDPSLFGRRPVPVTLGEEIKVELGLTRDFKNLGKDDLTLAGYSGSLPDPAPYSYLNVIWQHLYDKASRGAA